MTRQLISTNRQLLLRHVTRSVRRAAGFVQVPLGEMRFVANSAHVLISSNPFVDRENHKCSWPSRRINDVVPPDTRK